MFVKLNINTHRHGDPAPPSTYFLKLDLWVVTVGLPTSGSRVLIPLLKFSLWCPFLFCCLVVGFLPPSFHADSSVWLYRMYFHPFPLSFPWDLHIRKVKSITVYIPSFFKMYESIRSNQAAPETLPEWLDILTVTCYFISMCSYHPQQMVKWLENGYIHLHKHLPTQSPAQCFILSYPLRFYWMNNYPI